MVKSCRDLLAKYRLARRTDVACIELDVSALTAAEAAAAISRHCTQASYNPVPAR